MNTLRQQIVRIICSERGKDDIRAVRFEDRRLAVYRRGTMAAYEAMFSCERKLKAARSETNKVRWTVAVDFWRAVGEYFSDQIKEQCGERF